MELEEAIRLEKWKENVPMMTIEGQPLSENVKKRRDALVAYATAKAQANGGLFEDSGGPYNDAAISAINGHTDHCLLYTSPSPRDGLLSRMPSSA